MRDLSTLAGKCPHYKFPEGNNIKYRLRGRSYKGVPSDRIFYHDGFGGTGRHCLVAEGYGGLLLRNVIEGERVDQTKPIFMNKEDLIPPIYVPQIVKSKQYAPDTKNLQWSTYTGFTDGPVLDRNEEAVHQNIDALYAVYTTAEDARQVEIRNQVEEALHQVVDQARRNR
jgi:hypothetical protein